MSGGMRDADFEAWVDEARAIPLLETALGLTRLKKAGLVEWQGPCPACGGRDRFSVNTRKGVWHCRVAGKGGDVIGLAQYAHGLDFVGACEWLTGRPPPRDMSAAERARRHAEAEALRAELARRRAEQERRQSEYRERELGRLKVMWDYARPVSGSPVEAYLARRGLIAPAAARLRFAPDHKLWGAGEKAKELHRGPAMVAAIVREDGRFCGLHATWIDLAQPNGKALVPDPATGEFAPAKKVRGSKTGGRIELVRHPAPTRLFAGEGIETVLSVWRALFEARSPLLEGAAFWSSVDLGNLGGRAMETRAHPTLVITDKRGRGRPVRYGGPEPDMTSPAMPVPDTVTDLVLLGDGDSDRIMIEATLTRAAARHARAGRTVRIAWAPEGMDFNDLLRGRAA